jgi:hypothetical protein
MSVTAYATGARYSSGSSAIDKATHIVLRGLFTASGGAATLQDSDYTAPAYLKMDGTEDATDLYLDANSDKARVLVGSNAAEDWRWTIHVMWNKINANP